MTIEPRATQLPAKIIDDWDRRLRFAGCNEQHRSALKNVIESTFPYPSRDSLLMCIAGYQALYPDKDAIEPDETTATLLIKELKSAGQLQTSGRFATTHPVAEAIKQLTQSAKKLQLDPSPSLRFYIRLSQLALHHHEQLTAEIYYKHCYFVRDVLLYRLRMGAVGAVLHKETIAQTCSKAAQQLDNGERTPVSVAGFGNLKDKLQTTIKLIDGPTQFGVPERELNNNGDTASGTGRRKASRSAPDDAPTPDYLQLLPEDINASSQRPKVSKKTSLSFMLEEGGTAGHRLDKPQKTGEKTEPAEDRIESADINQDTMAPPEYSRAERGKCYETLLHVQAGQNTLSRCDSQRYSRRQLSTWLELFAKQEPLMACFLLMTWTLGMPSERLKALLVSTQLPTKDNAVVLNPRTHQLTYRILHLGATSEESHPNGDKTGIPDNHLMRLVLPESLVTLIVTSETDQPFWHIDQKHYQKLKTRIQKTFQGRLCSLTQWAASAPAFEVEAFNTLESAVKRGTMDFNDIAASAYRTHDRHALNAKFADQLSALRDYWDAEGLMTGQESAAFRNLSISADYPNGIIGSVRYAPPHGLAPVVRAIRNAIKQSHGRLNNPYKRRPFTELISLINRQQLNYFLVLQLHTLGRALNNKTTVGISTEGLWVSDKSSRQYRERKLIYSIAPTHLQKNPGLLLKSREHNRQTFQRLKALAERLKMETLLDTTATEDLPFFVEWSPRKPSIKVFRMTPAKWQRAIDDLGLNALWTQPGNVFRHVGSTELSATLSDAVVNEALGHKHPGRDWWGSESAGTLEDLTVTKPFIEQWAMEMGLSPLQLEHDVFEGRYDPSQ